MSSIITFFRQCTKTLKPIDNGSLDNLIISLKCKHNMFGKSLDKQKLRKCKLCHILQKIELSSCNMIANSPFFSIFDLMLRLAQHDLFTF